MIEAGESVFVDTNVLVTATVPARPLHAQALAVLNTWPSSGADLCISGQVLREYLVVATRPVAVNGLGLLVAQALDNVNAFLTRVRILDETRAVVKQLLDLTATGGFSGKRLHDANILATALAHGMAKLVTDDARSFPGGGGLVVLGLADATEPAP